MKPTAVAIFAKAPIEGFAKTRLIPRLGAIGAALLQRRLIERSVQTAVAAALGPVSLWCTPSVEHDIFQTFAAQYDIRLYRQLDTDDLGARMLHAFEELTSTGPALVVGTDCAVIKADHLRHSADLLSQSDAVAVPVEDGGYILIGLNRVTPSLFAAIDWGTAAVMDQTRQRAKSLSIDLKELPRLWDIDHPEDYDRAVALGVI